MTTITKKHYIAAALGAAFLLSFITVSNAAEPQTFIVEENGVVTETIVGQRFSNADEGRAPASAPFRRAYERLPAGTAIVGDYLDNGPALFDVVNYASTVVSRNSGELVLSTTLSKMEDEATLSALADKIYMEHNGPRYENVTIYWREGANPAPAAPFARTDIQRDASVNRVTFQ